MKTFITQLTQAKTISDLFIDKTEMIAYGKHFKYRDDILDNILFQNIYTLSFQNNTIMVYVSDQIYNLNSKTRKPYLGDGDTVTKAYLEKGEVIENQFSLDVSSLLDGLNTFTDFQLEIVVNKIKSNLIENIITSEFYMLGISKKSSVPLDLKTFIKSTFVC